MVIAEEEETAAVQLVAAAPRDDIDCAGGCDAGGEIEVDAGDLKFLNDLLREVLLGAAIHRIVDAGAIYSDAGAVGVGAENGDVHGAVIVALVIAGDGYPRREESELQEA